MGFPTFFPPHASRFSAVRRSLVLSSGVAGGASGITDPDDISNMTGWWDGEDDATIVEAPAGFAQRWNSKGATAKSYQNLLGGQTPALVTVSGHQMLNFDGVNDVLADVQSNDVLQPGSGDFTVVGFFRSPVGLNGNAITWRQEDAGGGTPFWGWRVFGNPGSTNFAMRDGATTLVVASTDENFADGSTRYVIMGMRDGTDQRLFYGGDGIDLVETSMGATTVPGGFGSVDAVNSALGNFTSVTAGFFWAGDLGELVFYKKALNQSERFNLFGYFRSKWGLTSP